jgi:hypothetical protein
MSRNGWKAVNNLERNLAHPWQSYFADQQTSQKHQRNFIMNENLHTPDSYYCRQQTLKMSENLSWTKTCIPLDSFIIAVNKLLKSKRHERKLAYPWQFYYCRQQTSQSRETYHQYISVMNGWKAVNINLMKEILHTFDSYCRQQTLKSQRNLIWTKTCIPLTVLLPTNFKCKRSLSMNENLHVPLDSFIIAVNKLLKSKRNLSWTKTCIPL